MSSAFGKCPEGVHDCSCSLDQWASSDPIIVAQAWHDEHSPPTWALWLLTMFLGVGFWATIAALIVIALT